MTCRKLCKFIITSWGFSSRDHTNYAFVNIHNFPKANKMCGKPSSFEIYCCKVFAFAYQKFAWGVCLCAWIKLSEDFWVYVQEKNHAGVMKIWSWISFDDLTNLSCCHCFCRGGEVASECAYMLYIAMKCCLLNRLLITNTMRVICDIHTHESACAIWCVHGLDALEISLCRKAWNCCDSLINRNTLNNDQTPCLFCQQILLHR